MNIVGILLAAGKGSRFDPTGAHHKLLAQLPDGTPVALASARAMCAALPRVVAVVPRDAGPLSDMLATAGCEISTCADAHLGMAASLVHGVRHCLTSADGWVIGLADMPFVLPSTINAVARRLGGQVGIVQPRYLGQRGNPVGFTSLHTEELLALTGDQGARELLRRHPVATLDTEDRGILRDIDLPADLTADPKFFG